MKNMCMEAHTAMPVIGKKEEVYNNLTTNGMDIMNKTRKGDMSNTQTFICRHVPTTNAESNRPLLP